MTPGHGRTGGDLLVESLAAVNTHVAFGVPGQHALGTFDALRRSGLRYVGNRTELSAAYAADGYARRSGCPGVVLVSTGPGALGTLPALQESAAASVPVVVIASQIPQAGLGKHQGYLHELSDQRAAGRGIVKDAQLVRNHGSIADAVVQAWEEALTPPHGPVWLEIPQDILLQPTDLPPVEALNFEPGNRSARSELIGQAARRLNEARRPAIIAGGGVVRAGAEAALLELAERVRAPTVTTFGANAAFPRNHPLAMQSWLEDQYTTEFLEEADVLVVVGSGLGELTSNYHTLRPRGAIIHIDASQDKLGANHPSLSIHADAEAALVDLAANVQRRQPDGVAERRVADLLTRVRARLSDQHLEHEEGLLAAVRNAIDSVQPADIPSYWDMTMLAYWAWSAWDGKRPGAMQSAQGSGGLGYAYPAAVGAAAGGDGPVLAVSGDGGAAYGLAELATARQHELDVTWLIVDDGGYGILREYMADAFGEAYATELTRPDFVQLAQSFGVPAVASSPSTLEADLAAALSAAGPSVVVLETEIRMFEPTHRRESSAS